MSNIMTVNKLLEECKKAKANGFGDKQILISSDDEGNSFHSLIYGFTTKEESIAAFANSFHDSNNVNDVVLLG